MLGQLDPLARAEDYAQAQRELTTLEDQIRQFPAQAETVLQKMISEMQRQLNEARQAGALELIPEEFSAAVTCWFAADATRHLTVDGLADMAEYTAKRIISFVTGS